MNTYFLLVDGCVPISIHYNEKLSALITRVQIKSLQWLQAVSPQLEQNLSSKLKTFMIQI